MEIVALLLGALLGAAPQENAGADCQDIVAFQVLLDRSGFSPGEIDGRAGANTTRALTAFQEAKGLPPTGTTDCATRKALGGAADPGRLHDHAGRWCRSVYRVYSQRSRRTGATARAHLRVAPRAPRRAIPRGAGADRGVKPRCAIRRGRNDQGPGGRAVCRHREAGDSAEGGWSAGPRRSLARGIAEGDRRRRIARDVRTGHERQRARPAAARSVEGALGELDAVVQLQPRPLLGRRSIAHEGTHQAGAEQSGRRGVDRHRQGALRHRTARPSRSKVGHTQSHGCVRLTNWDAARLAALVAPGTPVIFK